ncbi:MAG: DevR family CRISPR-associated autoregulator [Chloroflexi bacterium]|nr:DevR family CRISPR-associated autoregulator [Chloroflexota bacterium]
MSATHSLAISARLTMNLHNLNSEGTEGNQQQTRMVHVVDTAGSRQSVNAVSGDMFKRILVDHLIPLLEQAGQPLSPGARRHSPDRIVAGYPALTTLAGDKTKPDADVMAMMIRDCAATDLAGALLTDKRAVGRKSVVELGWVVGLPDWTRTEQYLHVKYAPEGRGAATGGTSVAERQALFHRPASSGVYALVCNLDLYRIGLNDITRQYVVSAEDRRTRGQALLQALAATLLKPAGAQRNTQNPHIVGCEGIISLSRSSLPAPLVSPLSNGFVEEVERCARALGRIEQDVIVTERFATASEAVDVLAKLSAELALPERAVGS